MIFVPSFNGFTRSFLPSNIRGLVVWLNAQNLPLADGELVSTWEDMSGRRHHATASGTARPTFKVNQINGKSVVRFNGTANFMRSPYVGPGQNFTFIIAIKPTSAYKADSVVRFQAPENGSLPFVVFPWSDAGANFQPVALDYDNGSTADSLVTRFDSSFSVGTYVSAGSTTGGRITRQNGIIVDSGDTTTTTTNTVLDIGSYNLGTLGFYSGDIAEILIYNRALSTAEITQAENYLMAKYNVFSPDQISGIALWLKADAVVQDNNTAISTWYDHSGNSRNATQAGAARPLLMTNVINGKPIVRLDGIDDYFNVSLPSSTPYTFFTVCKKRTTGVRLPILGGPLNNDPYALFFYSDDAVYIKNRGSTSTKQILSEPGTSFAVWSSLSSSGNSYSIRKNGSAPTLVDIVDPTNAADFSLIGRRTSDTTFGDGDIAEIIFYNVALTAAQIVQIETYLNRKYALF